MHQSWEINKYRRVYQIVHAKSTTGLDLENRQTKVLQNWMGSLTNPESLSLHDRKK